MADSNEAGSSKKRTSAEIEEEDGEEIVTITEALKSQDEQYEETVAVLGAGDDTHCSYDKGYMNRQALYACVTCCPEAKTNPSQLAGVCLACSYHCHADHVLIELYTKRNFRCDCGNKKFSQPCTLNPKKDDFNTNNQYNQNFYGLYCTCARPYPNPEDPIEDEMLQCVVCEDWYHTRHLGVPVPPNFAEMICINCIRENDFLLNYDGLTITQVTAEAAPEVNVSVDDEKKENINDAATPAVGSDTATKCSRPSLKSDNISAKFFLHESWRQNLCRCDECLSMYKEKHLEFLIDENDPVQVYEEKGKAIVKGIEEAAAQETDKLINSMGRVPMMELLAGYNDFKAELSGFLKTFAENNKVLKLDDVNGFFAELRAKKKQKLEGMSYYCK